jgi:hypothetical protein
MEIADSAKVWMGFWSGYALLCLGVLWRSVRTAQEYPYADEM